LGTCVLSSRWVSADGIWSSSPPRWNPIISEIWSGVGRAIFQTDCLVLKQVTHYLESN
jgi:hypothetical protein